MTSSEAALNKTFKKMKRTAEQIDAAKDSATTKRIVKKLTLPERKLLRAFQEGGGYELLRAMLPSVGTFYRTTDNDLLFFRLGDHTL